MITTISDMLLHQELERFLLLATDNPDVPMRMPACPVDTYWHAVEGTPDYLTVARQLTAGGTIDHVPAGGHDAIEWVARYEEAYGPLPEVWFTSATDGSLDEDEWERYQRTGCIPRLSWDCGPQVEQGTKKSK